MNTNQIYFSDSAYQNGFGSARFKAVCGQTKTERALVQQGEIVIFDSGRKSCGHSGDADNCVCGGTVLRQIVYSNGYWNPRVPSDAVIARYAAGEYQLSESADIEIPKQVRKKRRAKKSEPSRAEIEAAYAERAEILAELDAEHQREQEAAEAACRARSGKLQITRNVGFRDRFDVTRWDKWGEEYDRIGCCLTADDVKALLTKIREAK